MLLTYSVILVISFLNLVSSQVQGRLTPDTEGLPRLSGRHFRISVVNSAFLLIGPPDENGERNFSGYLVKVLRHIAREDRANFTYDLFPPSGYSSGCSPRLDPRSEEYDHAAAYSDNYKSDYQCAESDVNDKPISNYTTDLYWGMFYMTTKRLLVSQMTVPFYPPFSGALGMLGTATNLHSIEDLVTNRVSLPVCVVGKTAYAALLRQSFPHMEFLDVFGQGPGVYSALNEGSCEVFILPYNTMGQMLHTYRREGTCLANGRPIGIIGKPLDYGFTSFAFGVRSDISPEVVNTLNFWLQTLMTCLPSNPDSFCPEDKGGGSLSELYDFEDATGLECGYVQFPGNNESLPMYLTIILVIFPVIILFLFFLYHWHKLSSQEKRMKKRFVQQIARNIEIGPSVKTISIENLTETFSHIGGSDDVISKKDLLKWMNDLRLDFLSEHDFDRLFNTMDLERRGFVDIIDFVNFIKECSKQFEEVHQEISALPKVERLKLAARRLENFSELGEDEVLRMERRMERKSRQAVCLNRDVSMGAKECTRNLLNETSEKSLRSCGK